MGKKGVKRIAALCIIFSICVLFTACKTANTKGAVQFVRMDIPRTISFPGADYMSITADVYMPYPETAPLILLCHRAFWSRGEYREIAPILTEQGFNVIAVDLRSGAEINGITNKTNELATLTGKRTLFVDSLQDIQSAVDYVKEVYAKGTFILWGSSYASSLGVIIAKNNPDKIDAFIAFSPGEYFSDPEQGKPADWIAQEAVGVTIPVFFSSDSTEVEATKAIFDKIPSKKKTSFFPAGESRHGAEALYAQSPSSAETWEALLAFLQPFAVRR